MNDYIIYTCLATDPTISRAFPCFEIGRKRCEGKAKDFAAERRTVSDMSYLPNRLYILSAETAAKWNGPKNCKLGAEQIREWNNFVYNNAMIIVW